MLLLVHRGPLTCNTRAVYAVAGAGSADRLELFFDPCPNH